jgi:hypothetical protein
VWQRKLLTSWQPGRRGEREREREREIDRDPYFLQPGPTVTVSASSQ